MFRDIAYEEVDLKKDKYLLIDVRSENEYEEATIPGAVNIPLFNNEERALVGTVYKQEGPLNARELGLKIVSPKIPSLVQAVRDNLKEDKYPLFFCWRGGMRSKSMATFYDLVYPKTFRLDGGYRAYREYILEKTASIKINTPAFVLHGMTGVGKTILLHKLKEKGLTVIDLEGLAGHRGSVFGAIGLEPNNQKTFDSNLYELLKVINKQDGFLIEAESKRIGKISVPDNILSAKEQGHHILTHASLPIRIGRILDEYQLDKNKENFVEAYLRIERRLPTEIRTLIRGYLETNDFYHVIELLLTHYYDPKYQFATDQYQGGFYEVSSDDIDEAVNKIQQYMQEVIQNKTVLALK